MKETRILDTSILSGKAFRGTDGEMWKQLEIGAEGLAFEPGQFLMAAKKSEGTSWPSPLLIQRASSRGAYVWVHPNSPLYRLEINDAVTIWGPNGTAPRPEQPFALLAGGGGALAVAPFAAAYPALCRGIYITDEAPAVCLLPGDIPVRQAALRDLGGLEEVQAACKIIAALPLTAIAEWKRHLSPALAEKTWIMAGVKIGCGIGGCRGCHIHSETHPHGLAVCQEGPFLPLTDIDYSRDQNFLAHFI